MPTIHDSEGNPRKPEDIHPLGHPDARFPAFYQESVPNGLRVMAEFFTALAQRNLDATHVVHLAAPGLRTAEPRMTISVRSITTISDDWRVR